MILFDFLTLTLIFSFAVSCPLSMTNRSGHYPCTCRSIHRRTVVECSGIANDLVLSSAVNELRSTSIKILTLENVVLRYLPHDLFHGMDINTLEFKDSTLVRFSDTDIAFEGLENSLRALEFQDCSFMNSWDFSQLKNMKKLMTLSITRGDINSINEDIQEVSSLAFVTFWQTELLHIDDYAFANFTELESLSLVECDIKEIKRSMLPNPAYWLVLIDLRGNGLQTIPEDFFTNMPVLSTVLIANNRFTTLKEETFAPVWNQLRDFQAYNNFFRCDCRMKWIFEKSRKSGMQSFIGICSEPLQYRGMKVESLEAEDLRCWPEI